MEHNVRRNSMMSAGLANRIGVLVIVLAIPGCVTRIQPAANQNPPPRESFSAFTRFELLPLKAATAEVATQPEALASIQSSIDERLKTRLDQWNQKSPEGAPRTLVIEPIVTELKFVGAGKRVFTGALAGSSAVVMRAKFTAKESGAQVAYPEFYAQAAAIGGAWSFSGSDNAMLARIGNSLAVYVFSNYKQAVGGPVMPPETEASSVATD